MMSTGSSNFEFDEEWYLAFNPDVREAIGSGRLSSGGEHYQHFGALEGRRASPYSPMARGIPGAGEAHSTKVVGNAIWSLSLNEFARWDMALTDTERATAKALLVPAIDERGAHDPSVWAFDVSGGVVFIRDKKGDIGKRTRPRAELYKSFIQETITTFGISGKFSILMMLEDTGLSTPFPAFSFQRNNEHNSILLPDPDFLDHDFMYPYRQMEDCFATGEKLSSAIFAGATTGETVTIDTIERGTNTRVRAGMYFRGSGKVRFLLPIIAECPFDDARQMLIDMGFGDRVIVSWYEQFKHRFIISADGNGATCSRLPIILASNSVLLKYDSRSVLYYFSLLRAWQHYIPIYRDSDVESIVDVDRSIPNYFDLIRFEGQRFARAYLTKYRAMWYTASVLSLYWSRYFEGDDPHLLTPLGRAALGHVIAHRSSVGDETGDFGTLIGVPRSGTYIEGLAIEPGAAFSRDDIAYEIVREDGRLSARREAGTFCGTRGVNRPIRGFRIAINRKLTRTHQVHVTGYFLDGTVITVPDGVVCASGTLAPLEAFRIDFALRPDG